MEDHEKYETIEQYTGDARKQGFRYVTFNHPNIGNDDHHHAVISLFPNQDLQIFDIEKA